MIQIEDWNYNYGKVMALSHISLSVKKGEIFGLLGPDGAGKTTLIQTLVTLQDATSGSAALMGMDIRADYKKIRPMIGFMPGTFSLYPDLTVQENLTFFARLFGTTVEENYNSVAPIYRQLEPFRNRRAAHLSGGMKQKLALCCALIHKPEILFLDEPTTGVDAISRVEFWDMLHTLRDGGLTIFVSTPYMNEASRCDRVAFINHGKLLGIDTPQNFILRYKDTLYSARTQDTFSLTQQIRSIPGVIYASPFGSSVHFVMKKDVPAPEIDGVEVKQIQPDIEDVFISLIMKTSPLTSNL